MVSQNVDGLFLRAGIPRSKISELHGNFFLDECSVCNCRFIRSTPSTTMGLKTSGPCRRQERPCRGHWRDTILDWEDDLPPKELQKAERYSNKADLCICLGTSLQIVPAANLPFLCKRRSKTSLPGRVVIVNLQKTKYDHKADLVIHDYIDDVLVQLCKCLDIQIPLFRPETDPTNRPINDERVYIWK